jgi:hypothetical protein
MKGEDKTKEQLKKREGGGQETPVMEKRIKNYEMDNIVNFMRTRNIDSFQKLRLVLFLQQYPEWAGTGQRLAKRLYLKNVPLVEGILSDLQQAGPVECVAGRFKLRDDPDIRSTLQCLATAYENPLARLQLLDQLRPGASLKHYLKKAHTIRLWG